MKSTATPAEILRDRPTASVAETAGILTCSEAQVYAMAEKGELDSVRIGRRVVIKTDSIRRLLGD